MHKDYKKYYDMFWYDICEHAKPAPPHHRHFGPGGPGPHFGDHGESPPFEDHRERPPFGDYGDRPPFGCPGHGPEGDPRFKWHMVGRDIELPEDDSLNALFRKCIGKTMMKRGRPTAQDGIIRILSEEGDLSQRILQKVLGVQPGSLSETLSKLEDKGLIKRERDEVDKRRVIVALTDEGKEYAKKNIAFDRDGVAANLTDEEKETLRTLLKKILE